MSKYGWRRDNPDQRDHYISFFTGVLPTEIDLRSNCPPIYDQGQLGSCTANAIAASLEFSEIKEKKISEFTPSRLFIYYNEREKEGTVNSDAGASLRDGIKSVAKLGACPEFEWPYNIDQFTIKPSESCYADALNFKAIAYQKIHQDNIHMKACLAAGYPFVFGFTVYESFESDEVAKTGNVPMPAANESVIGGHAVLAVGYNDIDQKFIVRNSWGVNWGMSGYFTMPYGYVTASNLASDFWVIQKTS
jgi:C1A family cysteine protease